MLGSVLALMASLDRSVPLMAQGSRAGALIREVGGRAVYILKGCDIDELSAV